MNKVVTIHLNGTAYQLEEAGYEALHAYLETAARHLAANPDRDEIIADIEQAIGEKCRARLSGHRTVVLTKDIEAIIAEMGPVHDTSAADAGPANASATTGATSDAPPPATEATAGVKRLYRIYDGAMISGVCNGIAAYFSVDPTLVRAGFVVVAVLSLFVSFVPFFAVVLAYLALVLLIPAAKTDSEKAAAHGIPATAQEFIRRAQEGYYNATKNFRDKHVRREWQRTFRREMRQWRRQFRFTSPATTGAVSAPAPGFWLAVGFFGLLLFALTVAWLVATLSLLVKGNLLGFALPEGMPVWVAVLLLCVLFQCLAWPLRVSRHALHAQAGLPCGSRPGGPIEMLTGLLFLGFGVWLLDRYVPGVHEFLVQVPPTLERFTDHVQAWWARR